MRCRNCGTAVDEKAVICVNCGSPPASGRAFCQNCGAATDPNAVVCVKCGVSLASSLPGIGFAQASPGTKSKMAAGILGIMVGGFGVHNFYLGYTGKAVAQLLLMIVGIVLACVFVGYFMIMAAYIWGLVEGVMILTGSINTDADGNPLKD
ncbi:MAG: TM2 domain-containing protein [Thermoleophilia bacterium]